MKRVYRILRKAYSKTPFDGEGAVRYGGRWSSPGTRIVYTSEHLSLAHVEYFVHLEVSDAPRDLVVVAADVPDGVSRKMMTPEQLPSRWRRIPSPASLTVIGDSFVADNANAILVVPSAIVPQESNWLINPFHPEFRKIKIHPPEAFRYDVRFFS